jgi:hypothetical protein
MNDSETNLDKESLDEEHLDDILLVCLPQIQMSRKQPRKKMSKELDRIFFELLLALSNTGKAERLQRYHEPELTSRRNRCQDACPVQLLSLGHCHQC